MVDFNPPLDQAYAEGVGVEKGSPIAHFEQVAQAIADSEAALQGILDELDGKSDATASGKMFGTRTSAVTAGQAALSADLGMILTREADYTVVRAPNISDDDPLFGTAPYWGVAMRLPSHTQLVDEATARAAGDAAAQGQIAAEATTRAAGDAAANTRIDNLSASVSTERDERVEGQQQLRTDVDAAQAQLADPISKTALMPSNRPGATPWLHATGIAGGDPYALPPVASVAVSVEGAVARVIGTGVVSDRRLHAIEPDRQYGVRFAFRRAVNTPDPAGDAVRLAVAWYDRNGAHLSNTTLENLTNLTVASGRHTRAFKVARGASSGVVAGPAGGVYARPYVQTYGTTVQTDIEVIDLIDVTDLSVWAPDVSDFSARLAAQESLDAGDRLGVLEAEVGTPATRRYKTVADAAADTLPASVDVIEVLGRVVAGDRGAAPYKRTASEPSHGGKFQTADGAWWEIEPAEIRVEQFATPAAAVGYALAKGRQVVSVDLPTALADGANRSNVILRGDGEIPGTNIDSPAYRRPVVPANAPTARAMPDRWLLADHWTREATVRVVVLGDSLTTYGADALTAQDGLTLHLERVLRRSNPTRQVEVISRGIGAQRYQEIDSLPILSYPVADRYPWYTDDERPWLDYVADLNPHIVVLSSGMNDQAGFDRAAFESVVAKVTAMASKPQIVIATNMAPNLAPSAAQASFGTYAGQEGRDYVAGWIRTYADYYGYSLIDIGRTFGIVRDGRDVCDTYFEALAEETFGSATRYTAPVDAACRDYTFRGQIDAAAWTNAPPFSIKIGPGNNNTVFVVNSGGFLRFRFYRGGSGSLYREVTSAIPTPGAAATVEVTLRGSFFSFRVIPATAGAEAGAQPFTATVIRHGGLFRPELGYFSGGVTGPVLTATLGVGRERLYMPAITDFEMWGDTSGSGARAATGGNGANHPTSRGASAVYGLHFSGQQYLLRRIEPYGLGETMMARIDGTDAIGAFQPVAGERLWPSNAAGTVPGSQAAQLAGTVWESRGAVIGTTDTGRTTSWIRVQ